MSTPASSYCLLREKRYILLVIVRTQIRDVIS